MQTSKPKTSPSFLQLMTLPFLLLAGVSARITKQDCESLDQDGVKILELLPKALPAEQRDEILFRIKDANGPDAQVSFESYEVANPSSKNKLFVKPIIIADPKKLVKLSPKDSIGIIKHERDHFYSNVDNTLGAFSHQNSYFFSNIVSKNREVLGNIVELNKSVARFFIEEFSKIGTKYSDVTKMLRDSNSPDPLQLARMFDEVSYITHHPELLWQENFVSLLVNNIKELDNYLVNNLPEDIENRNEFVEIGNKVESFIENNKFYVNLKHIYDKFHANKREIYPNSFPDNDKSNTYTEEECLARLEIKTKQGNLESRLENKQSGRSWLDSISKFFGYGPEL